MGKGYQERDYEIIDYQLYQLDGVPRPLRGPSGNRTLEDGEYFCCIGAAQTFGCYTEKPFPLLLEGALGMPSLNFGVAGAGPSFFTDRPEFLERANRSRFAIIQVMSGRSTSNSLFESHGHEWLTRKSDGVSLGAAPAYREILPTAKDSPTVRTHKEAVVQEVLQETRANWVRENIELANLIRVPKILFWFSVRPPEYTCDMRDVHSFFGAFPQLVNREMIDAITPHFDDYVECISRRGMPMKLISRFTGKPTTITKRKDLGGNKKRVNDYYPSPQMHEDALVALLPCCKQIL